MPRHRHTPTHILKYFIKNATSHIAPSQSLSLSFSFLLDKVSLCSPSCPTYSLDQTGLEHKDPPASDSEHWIKEVCHHAIYKYTIHKQTTDTSLLSLDKYFNIPRTLISSSFCFDLFETESHHIVQTGLKLTLCSQV